MVGRAYFSLRLRFLALLVTPFAALLAAVTYFSLQDRDERIAATHRQIEATARTIAAQQADALRATRHLVDNLLEDREVRDFARAPGPCARHLAAELKQLIHIANITVANTRGEVVCSAVEPGKPVSYGDRAYFRKALATDDLVIGEVHVGRVVRRPVIPFAKALLAPDGSPRGVLVVALDVGWLNSKLSESAERESARLGLIDRQGNILARYPDPEAWVGRNAAHTPFFKTILKHQGEGLLEAEGFDGVTRLYALVPFVETDVGPIHFWLGVARESITGPIHSRLVLTLAVASLVLLAALGLAWLVSERWFLGPLLALSAAARHLKEGDLAARTGLPAGPDEMGELVASFDRMAEQLAANYARIEHQAAELGEARDSAEAAARAKSLFLANMSHEIRTPMNAILGMTELCLATRPNERQRNYLDKIRLASATLLRIIDDILDLSKIEAGKLDIAATPFALAAVFDGLRSMLADRAKARGLQLRLPTADLPVATLVGDSLRLTQILVNLVGNAIKFSERGEVEVGVAEEYRQGDRLTLHFFVRDQGIGISPEEQARLFQPFTQADPSTTRRFGGSGLGLAISKRLVDLMGGRIWVDSQPGRGSTFHFTLPFAITDQSPAIAAPRGMPADRGVLAGLKGADILLVEDTQLNQEVMTELLQEAGLKVRLAANGEEALAAVAARAPDCILMDCQMPVMDGLEATRRLRAEVRYRDLPIIALTANALAGDRESCLAAGMNGYLAKPVDVADLLAALARWIPPRAAAPDHAPPPSPPTAPGEPDLPPLAGIDTALGLHFLGGRQAFYRTLLRRFRDSRASDFAASFQAAAASADWATARRLAHTLKGVARNLGAAHLGDLAAAVEAGAAANREDQVQASLPALLTELERVLDGLAALDEGPAGEPAAVAAGDLPTLAGKFLLLLEDQDTAALAQAEALHRALAAGGEGEAGADIARAVAAYDFSRARQRLAEAAARLHIPLSPTLSESAP